MNFKHFVALNVADVLTTYYGLTYLGLTERNTFADGLFQEYGLIFALISMKIIGLMIIYGVMKLYPLNIKKIGINISCLIFIAVVVNNLYHIAYTTFIL